MRLSKNKLLSMGNRPSLVSGIFDRMMMSDGT